MSRRRKAALEKKISAEQRHYWDYLGSLTIVPPSPVRMGGIPIVDPLLRGIPDAARECRHGRLPMDKTEPCGCWGAMETRKPTPDPFERHRPKKVRRPRREERQMNWKTLSAPPINRSEEEAYAMDLERDHAEALRIDDVIERNNEVYKCGATQDLVPCEDPECDNEFHRATTGPASKRRYCRDKECQARRTRRNQIERREAIRDEQIVPSPDELQERIDAEQERERHEDHLARSADPEDLDESIPPQATVTLGFIEEKREEFDREIAERAKAIKDVVQMEDELARLVLARKALG